MRSMFLRTILCAFLSLVAFPAAADEPSVSQCNPALIKAIYHKEQFKKLDWRYYDQIDETSWNELKREFGANALLGKIPVGASFSDFQKNVQSQKTTHEESLSQTEWQNVSWTMLDSNGAAAYQTCLETVAKMKGTPLVLAPSKATKDSVSLKIIYKQQGTAWPVTIPVTWSGDAALIKRMPQKIDSGSRIVVVPRPAEETQLAINSSVIGEANELVLTPYPKPLPPEVLHSEPLRNFSSGADTTTGGFAVLNETTLRDGRTMAGILIAPQVEPGDGYVIFSLDGRHARFITLRATNGSSSGCSANDGTFELLVRGIEPDGQEKMIGRTGIIKGGAEGSTARIPLAGFKELKLEIDGKPERGRWCDAPFVMDPQVEVAG